MPVGRFVGRYSSYEPQTISIALKQNGLSTLNTSRCFLWWLSRNRFASISNPPNNAYKYCFVISAVGHAIRFVLMNNSYYHFGLIIASFVAALSIGFLTVLMARRAKCPPETFSFPSLLPMIPGMYAYRTIEGLVMCLFTEKEDLFQPLFVSLYIEWLYLCVRYLR